MRLINSTATCPNSTKPTPPPPTHHPPTLSHQTTPRSFQHHQSYRPSSLARDSTRRRRHFHRTYSLSAAPILTLHNSTSRGWIFNSSSNSSRKAVWPSGLVSRYISNRWEQDNLFLIIALKPKLEKGMYIRLLRRADMVGIRGRSHKRDVM